MTSDQSAVSVKPKARPAMPSKEKLEAALDAILDAEEFHVQPVVSELILFLDDSERKRPKPGDVLQLATFLSDARSELAGMTRALDKLLDCLSNFTRIAEGDKYSGRDLRSYYHLSGGLDA
jgi:hypothetical protein